MWESARHNMCVAEDSSVLEGRRRAVGTAGQCLTCVVLVWMLICFGGWCGSVENGLGFRKSAQPCVELVGWGLTSAVCPRKIQIRNNGWGGGMNM